MKIFFVGFMGSGKTFWAKKLASQLNVQTIDLDEEIVKGEGKSIPQLFKELGENGFRLIESRYLAGILRSDFAGIISCGGGTPCFYDQMELMKRAGVVFYLQEEFDVLFERIRKDISTRPLLANKSEMPLKSFLFDLFQSRESCYLKSHKILIMNQINESKFAKILISYV